MKLEIFGKNFYTRRLNKADALRVTGWRYEGVQSVYDIDGSPEEIAGLTQPLNYALCESFGGEIFAFVTLGPQAALPLEELEEIYADESFTDLALGLRPDACGKGMGKYVIGAGILLASEVFPGDGFRVTVARNNIAALSVYETFGFVEIAEFTGEILHPDKKGNIIATATPMEILIAGSGTAERLKALREPPRHSAYRERKDCVSET